MLDLLGPVLPGLPTRFRAQPAALPTRANHRPATTRNKLLMSKPTPAEPLQASTSTSAPSESVQPQFETWPYPSPPPPTPPHFTDTDCCPKTKVSPSQASTIAMQAAIRFIRIDAVDFSECTQNRFYRAMAHADNACSLGTRGTFKEGGFGCRG